MFDSLLRYPNSVDQAEGLEHQRSEIQDLKQELTRTREELDTLRETTARVLTAVVGELQSRHTPLAEVASEIQELSELSSAGPADGPVEDPITGEMQVIDLTNQESLTYLDRRFRWVPSKRARA